MKWLLPVSWLLLAAVARTEVPLDLNSPFPKVALVKTKTGEVEKREIANARLVGGAVEMEKAQGGVTVFPIQDVIAILPLLPKSDESYTAEQTQEAISILKGVAPDLLREAGLDHRQIQDWEALQGRLIEVKKQKELAERKSQEAREAEAKANLTKEVQDWVTEASDFRMSRQEKELVELRQKGETLARKSPEHMDVILQALAVLSQVQPKEKGEPLPELSKLNEVQSRLIPDDLLGWLAGGVLIFSILGLLFGLAFLSSSLTRFKEGAFLGGIVFGMVSLTLWGVLIWTWSSPQVAGEAIPPRVDPKMEELGIFLKNRSKPVYYFPAKKFSFSAEEWRSGMLGYLPVSDESVGLFKVKMKEGKLRLTEGQWIWQQPLTALGIPLPFQLTFKGKIPELQNWENPAISNVSLGRWPLPKSIADLLADSALSILKQGLASGGLAGVKLDNDDKGMILVSVPAAGTRPKYELAKEEKEEISKAISAYKKELSAEELAQAIVDRKGRDFLDKFVVIYGEVYSVGGSNFSSVGKMSRDQLEDIYLLGIRDFYGIGRPLLVKCQIKSDIVFQMDSRGDLYMRYVIQEFEQDKKRANSVEQSLQEKNISFKTIDDIEVTSPDIDPAKEKPLIYRGRQLQFLSPQRLELKASEINTGTAVGGITGRPPGTNQAGEIELYGIVLAPKSKVAEIIAEKEP